MDDVLFLAHRIPYPPNKGDKLRSYQLLLALRARYRVHLGCFVDDHRDWAHTARMTELCEATYFAPLSRVTAVRHALQAALRGRAITPEIYRHRGLADWVRTVLRDRRPRCAYVYSSAMAQFVDPATATRRIMDFVDVDSEKWRQRAAHARWPLSRLYRGEAERLLNHDRSVARRFDLSVFVSEHEAERFRELTPDVADKVVCLRNGVDTDYFDPQRGYLRPDSTGFPFVAFTGAMDYWPNEDAVIWFANKVLPLVRKDAPTLRFVIAGRDPSTRVRRLGARSDVEIVANPPDIRPYLAHAAAVVVPLRDSPGVANKVLEGLAMARPLVATPQAVAGISADPGRELLIAGTPAEFAQALSTVLGNLDVANRLGAAARQRVLTDYRWATNLAQLPRLIDGDPATRRATPQTA